MVGDFRALPIEERIIVALDCDREEALAIARSLQGLAKWVKVGMTLYYRSGPSIVAELRDLGYKVFVDLKLFDIPHQVKGAAASIAACGADLITVHASGGVPMMQAARAGVNELFDQVISEAPDIIGVTVLTSFDDAGLREVGIERVGSEQVRLLASCVAQAGLSGVVCSPHEAQLMRSVLGEEALVVCPGVRLPGAVGDDQKRVATPSFAFEQGASHIVVGRPITQAADRRRAFVQVAEG